MYRNLNNLVEKYIHILQEYLTKRFSGEIYIDPYNLNKERFHTKAIFIAVILYLKNINRDSNQDIITKTESWLIKTFTNKNLFTSIFVKSNNFLKELVGSTLQNSSIDATIDVPTLYETLFGIETANENNGTIVSTARNYRNKLGSYYTPNKLAALITYNTIDKYFEINIFGIKELSSMIERVMSRFYDMSNIKFADFSCGGGNFIIEIINHFKNIAKNFSLSLDKREAVYRKYS